MRLLASVLVFLIISSAALAAGPVILKASRMFDGKSDHLATPGVVVVVAGQIEAVGAGAAIPAGAEVIDLGDATLLPGFMDAHTHLSMQASDDWKQGSGQV
jgi:imidazolonepropionase-like amidohydrolase